MKCYNEDNPAPRRFLSARLAFDMPCEFIVRSVICRDEVADILSGKLTVVSDKRSSKLALGLAQILSSNSRRSAQDTNSSQEGNVNKLRGMRRQV